MEYLFVMKFFKMECIRNGVFFFSFHSEIKGYGLCYTMDSQARVKYYKILKYVITLSGTF